MPRHREAEGRGLARAVADLRYCGDDSINLVRPGEQRGLRRSSHGWEAQLTVPASRFAKRF